MGCWNETCFLTRLPILEGDPVKLLFIAEAGGGRNTVHPDGFWKPIALPFRGHYDGYGRIEDVRHDDTALGMLRAAELGARDRDAEDPEEKDPVPMDLSGLSGDGWEKALQEIIEKACRCELEGRVRRFARTGKAWAQVMPVMAHEWAWDHITNAVPVANQGWIGSITFRLSVDGPLRDALLRLDPVWGKDGALFNNVPEIRKGDALEIAGLLSGMEHMRIGLCPACGSGSQDIIAEKYQVEFYKQMFLRAAAMAHRYDEDGQAPFEAAIAWDGNFMTSDRNCCEDGAPDIPTGLDPDGLYMALLDAGVTNVLDAMAEAVTGGPGEPEEEGGSSDES